MTKEGLIVRRPCQRDGRRSFLGISPESYQRMLALAADALRTGDRVRARFQRSAAA
jgi:DNA-binding MarR family transcriptional regulator